MMTPPVNLVQTMVRIIYQDGTVGMIASDPFQVGADELEPTHVPTEQVMEGLRDQFEVLQSRIEDAGVEGIYHQVRMEGEKRRGEVVARAKASREKHRQQNGEDA